MAKNFFDQLNRDNDLLPKIEETIGWFFLEISKGNRNLPIECFNFKIANRNLDWTFYFFDGYQFLVIVKNLFLYDVNCNYTRGVALKFCLYFELKFLNDGMSQNIGQYNSWMVELWA